MTPLIGISINHEQFHDFWGQRDVDRSVFTLAGLPKSVNNPTMFFSTPFFPALLSALFPESFDFGWN